jgi:hypothetical protein
MQRRVLRVRTSRRRDHRLPLLEGGWLRAEDFTWAICSSVENDYAHPYVRGRSSFRASQRDRRASPHRLPGNQTWAPPVNRQTFAPKAWLERYPRRATPSQAINRFRTIVPLSRTSDTSRSASADEEAATYVPNRRRSGRGVNASPERLTEGRRHRGSARGGSRASLARLSSDERVFVRMRFEDGHGSTRSRKPFTSEKGILPALPKRCGALLR